MKKAKRIIAFALLIGIAFVLAYFVFTGKRFGRYPENAEALQGEVYVNENVVLSFYDTGLWYETKEKVLLLEIKEYADGVLSTERNGATYRFTVIDADAVYDWQINKILVRRG